MVRLVLLSALTILLSAVAASAEVAVVSGGRVKLASVGSFDQACHSQGRVSVCVIQQPHNGSLVVDTINDYPNFPAFNTHSRCNILKLPETRVSYQSAPGYIGTDEAVVELIFPDGNVKRYRFTISVRPGVLVPQAAPRAERPLPVPHRHALESLPPAAAREVRRAPPPPSHRKPETPAPKPADKPIEI